MTLQFGGWGLIRSLKRDYMATMTFTRQQPARHLLELAAFSLPALAVTALLLVALIRLHGLAAPSDSISLTPIGVVPPRELPMTKVEPVVSDELPPLETKPYEGLGPTLFGRNVLVRPDLPPAVPHEMTVQAGHSLWGIARDVYGNGRDFVLILSANRKTIAKPNLIHPGQQLVLPDKKAN